MNGVFVPMGGAARLPVQACSRAPDPERGFGPQKGTYHKVEPVVMAAECLYGTLIRLSGFRPEILDEVIVTCANPTNGQNFTGRTVVNVVRHLHGGEGWRAGGMLVNRLCGSGMTGQMIAANRLALTRDDVPLVIAVLGVEKMTDNALADIFDYDYTPAALDALGVEATTMGLTAEATADRFGVSRADCEALALAENTNYRAALEQGTFGNQIIPFEVDGVVIDQDAPADPVTMDLMQAKGKLFFRKKTGALTQFTSSRMSDGAGCLIMCNQAALDCYGWAPMAQYVDGAIGTVDPTVMGEGLIAAFEAYILAQYSELNPDTVRMFLNTYGLEELNTAFASVPLALIKKWGLDPTTINVAGGATTPLGHPLGATGVILVVKLLHLLSQRGVKFGYAGACVGEGQGTGIGYELLQATAA